MRYFGKDIRDTLKTKLSTDFNTMIATIRTERSDTTIPDCKSFTISNPTNQFPEISIDITDSEILNSEELTSNINNVPEIYNVEITAVMIDTSTSLDDYADYYIEAMQRVLQGYYTSAITWVLITKTNRTNITDGLNQTYKLCGVTCEVRIN
jgi:hypothetical protein